LEEFDDGFESVSETLIEMPFEAVRYEGDDAECGVGSLQPVREEAFGGGGRF